MFGIWNYIVFFGGVVGSCLLFFLFLTLLEGFVQLFLFLVCLTFVCEVCLLFVLF